MLNVIMSEPIILQRERERKEREKEKKKRRERRKSMYHCAPYGSIDPEGVGKVHLLSPAGCAQR